MLSIPAVFQADIDKATQILRDAGCTEGYLFGSIAKGKARQTSDIDLAVRGIPPADFFRVYGKLAMIVQTPIDLIDLDDQSSFSRRLTERGEFIRVI